MVKHYAAKSFVSSNSIGSLAKMVHSLIHDCADPIFADHDISFVQWIALLKLREGAALTPGDLCRLMCHDTGAITRMIDQLEQLGYVVRARSREDRRMVSLTLTAAGQKKLSELTPLVIDRLNLILSDFSKTEFAELTRLMKKLVDSLQTVKAADALGDVP